MLELGVRAFFDGEWCYEVDRNLHTGQVKLVTPTRVVGWVDEDRIGRRVVRP